MLDMTTPQYSLLKVVFYHLNGIFCLTGSKISMNMSNMFVSGVAKIYNHSYIVIDGFLAYVFILGKNVKERYPQCL